MKTKDLILAAMFAALTAVCAQISVPTPFSPVPVTLQVLSVFLSGIILGGRLGAISQLVYLALGAVGVPVFANLSGGAQKLIGVTGGYLLSYPIASYLIGKVSALYKGKSVHSTMVVYGFSMSIGLAIIYLLGSFQFAVLNSMTIQQSLKLTVIPFIIPDLIKLGISIPLAYSVKNTLLKAKVIHQL